MRKFYRITILVFLFLCLLWACENPFSFSPFEADVREASQNTTEENVRKIGELDTATNWPFKVALISDTHYHFNSLADAIVDINRKNEFSFIIVTGDISENGLLKEFEIFQQIMSHSHIPYVTVIGNHDYLSNGGNIYRQMFGPFNYSFSFHHVKFIAWDNTIWESEKEADFQWLRDALEDKAEGDITSEQYHHIIPFSHIPPTDGQFRKNREKYHALLKAHEVKLSVHGHKHTFSLHEWHGDGIRYMTVGSPQKRNYAALSITPDTITVHKIEY